MFVFTAVCDVIERYRGGGLPAERDTKARKHTVYIILGVYDAREGLWCPWVFCATHRLSSRDNDNTMCTWLINCHGFRCSLEGVPPAHSQLTCFCFRSSMSIVLSDVFSVLSVGPHVHVQGGVHQTGTGVLWHKYIIFLVVTMKL